LTCELLAAHRNVLAMRERVLCEYFPPPRTMFLAGDRAVFTSLPYSSYDTIARQSHLYFRIETILPGDNLGPNRLRQIIRPDGAPGPRLGEKNLRPLPLRTSPQAGKALSKAAGQPPP
jgi:hypothetical protein